MWFCVRERRIGCAYPFSSSIPANSPTKHTETIMCAHRTKWLENNREWATASECNPQHVHGTFRQACDRRQKKCVCESLRTVKQYDAGDKANVSRLFILYTHRRHHHHRRYNRAHFVVKHWTYHFDGDCIITCLGVRYVKCNVNTLAHFVLRTQKQLTRLRRWDAIRFKRFIRCDCGWLRRWLLSRQTIKFDGRFAAQLRTQSQSIEVGWWDAQ